jgi:hypothetical protein
MELRTISVWLNHKAITCPAPWWWCKMMHQFNVAAKSKISDLWSIIVTRVVRGAVFGVRLTGWLWCKLDALYIKSPLWHISSLLVWQLEGESFSESVGKFYRKICGSRVDEQLECNKCPELKPIEFSKLPITLFTDFSHCEWVQISPMWIASNGDPYLKITFKKSLQAYYIDNVKKNNCSFLPLLTLFGPSGISQVLLSV